MNIEKKNIVTDGLNITYYECGEADSKEPAVILLHGWGASLDLYSSVIRFIAGRYHVIAPVLPGFEGSDEPGAPMNVDDYADHVIRFISRVLPDVKDVILLGHSMGGRIIIKLCARTLKDEPGYPVAETDDREEVFFTIQKVILTDSAGVKPVQSGSVSRKTARYKRIKTLLTITGIAKLFPGIMEALRCRYGSADYRAASPLMRQTLVRVVNEDLTPLFQYVRVPALLIWGDNDTATPLSDGQLMEKLMPEAGLAVIQGAGHYCFLDAPVWYQKILNSFLEIER